MLCTRQCGQQGTKFASCDIEDATEMQKVASRDDENTTDSIKVAPLFSEDATLTRKVDTNDDKIATGSDTALTANTKSAPQGNSLASKVGKDTLRSGQGGQQSTKVASCDIENDTVASKVDTKDDKSSPIATQHCL